MVQLPTLRPTEADAGATTAAARICPLPRAAAAISIPFAIPLPISAAAHRDSRLLQQKPRLFREDEAAVVAAPDPCRAIVDAAAAALSPRGAAAVGWGFR